jgi:uncharacterized protein
MQATVHLQQMLADYHIEAIAIGNGTASRETRAFAEECLAEEKGKHVSIFVVSEDGASVYSASKTAREEFPDEDVTVRGAVSIGRRLMDPLSELVKIDPKSIGVGQYQHDVDQTKLKQQLDQTVMSCVNCCSQPLWVRNASWASTPDSEQDARWCVSMRKATCSTTRPSSPTRP